MGRIHRWAKKVRCGKVVKVSAGDKDASSGENAITKIINQLTEAKALVTDRDKRKAVDGAMRVLSRDNESSSETQENSENDSECGETGGFEKATNFGINLYPNHTWRTIIHLRDVQHYTYKHIVNRFRKLRNVPNAMRYISRKRSEFLSKPITTSHSDLESLDKAVWDIISTSDDNHNILHDCIIRDVAIKEAKKAGLSKFKASPNWIKSFKKNHGLVSRHIDQLVTNKKLDNADKLEQTIKSFQKNVWPRLKRQFSLKNLHNFDQTGMKMELTDKRTITRKGRKKVFRRIQKSSAVCHSVSLHVGINANGDLFRKTLVVLHEKTLPKKFIPKRNNFKYLTVRNSQSGLMNSNITIDWFENTFLPAVCHNSALVLDSWTGFNKLKQLSSVKRKKLHIETLPEGTTASLQPLDLFYNRQLKAFDKKMQNLIRLYHSNFDISNREHLLTLINAMLCQFSAPVFKDMGRFAWFKAGLTAHRPPTFVTPAALCFDIPASKISCDVGRCVEDTFLLCAHCHRAVCFSHFLTHLH